MSDRDPELQLLLDEAAIRRVLGRYIRATDRADFELMRSCYHPDAIDRHGTWEGRRDDFIEFVRSDLAKFEFSTHHLTNVIIEVCGDVALVESYALAFNGGRTAEDRSANYYNAYRYVDRFERRDGEWRIAERRVVLDWSLPWTPRRAEFEKYFPVGSMGPDDAVYQMGATVPGSRPHGGA